MKRPAGSGSFKDPDGLDEVIEALQLPRRYSLSESEGDDADVDASDKTNKGVLEYSIPKNIEELRLQLMITKETGQKHRLDQMHRLMERVVSSLLVTIGTFAGFGIEAFNKTNNLLVLLAIMLFLTVLLGILVLIPLVWRRLLR